VNRSESITQKLTAGLAPIHLTVEDESRMHNVPAGAQTHFKVLVVSAAFDGLGAIDRHRRVHAILSDERASGLHALTLRTLTPEQWAEEGGAPFESPKCLGGSKA
jgi:stress-induced morphogen